MRISFLISTVVFILGIFLVPTPAGANIIINEIMYDTPAADDGREWIEIANTGTEPVDVTGWKLFEANVNHSLAVSQGSMEIAPHGFAIIADNPEKFLLDWPGFSGTVLDSAFSLSNTGEALSIKDTESIVVDGYTYASSLGAGGNSHSLQRVASGWIAQAPTPGEVNETVVTPAEEIPPLEEPVDVPDGDEDGDQELDDPLPDDSESGDTQEEPEAPPPLPEPLPEAHVAINEIMYDVPGSDTGQEWIELFNKGPSSVDITGWKFVEDDVDHIMTFIQGAPQLGVADFVVVAENATLFILGHPNFTGMLFDSSFSLSNTGEALAIKDTQQMIRSEVTYTASVGAGGDGRTLQHFDAGFVAALPTPGAMNTYDSEVLDIENSTGGGSGAVGSDEDSSPENDNAPLIEEELTSSTVMQAPDTGIRENDPIIDPAIKTLIVGIVNRDRYSFVQIENPNNRAVDVSGITILSTEKSFKLPSYTIIAPNASIVVAHTKARFAGVNRAVWSEGGIIIE